MPHDHGKELLSIANKRRPKHYPEVKLFSFEEHLGLGHCDIFLHENIYPIIK